MEVLRHLPSEGLLPERDDRASLELVELYDPHGMVTFIHPNMLDRAVEKEPEDFVVPAGLEVSAYSHEAADGPILENGDTDLQFDYWDSDEETWAREDDNDPFVYQGSDLDQWSDGYLRVRRYWRH